MGCSRFATLKKAMTHFKELRRIEEAIEHRTKPNFAGPWTIAR
jgi:hypothetical protein